MTRRAGGNNGEPISKSNKLEPRGRLFRGLQLQRALSLSDFDRGPADRATDRGRLSRRAASFTSTRAYTARSKLDGLNLVVCASSDGPMGQGNWTGATYVDERANDRQTEALGAIFSGAAGGRWRRSRRFSERASG